MKSTLHFIKFYKTYIKFHVHVHKYTFQLVLVQIILIRTHSLLISFSIFILSLRLYVIKLAHFNETFHLRIAALSVINSVVSKNHQEVRIRMSIGQLLTR